jgi:hypothetical protein
VTPDQKFLAIGIYLNGALYFCGVFIAGLWTHNDIVWKLALAGVGFTYLLYAGQMMGAPPVANKVTMWLSLTAGAMAGVMLLLNIGKS